MVLLAAAIFSKDGKAILSRQFVEMSRVRIEGLLTAFPKLIGTDEKSFDKAKKLDQWKQHTFVETDSVRYVYQPLEKLYVLLLTTKASNILEDLETLRLFAKVIPEYSRSLDEYDVKENIFDIIAAFDEIVALGYKENVNLAQIRTFTEMDSHDERVFNAVRENQVRETNEKMKKKASEIQSKKDHRHPGSSMYGSGSSGGFGSNAGGSVPSPSLYSSAAADMGLRLESRSVVSGSTGASSAGTTYKTGGGKAMRLGGKAHVVDNFVDQLKAEGVSVMDKNDGESNISNVKNSGRARGYSNDDNSLHKMGSNTGTGNDYFKTEDVHVKLEEKIRINERHDSGQSNIELQGIMTLNITNNPDLGYLRLSVDIPDDSSHELQPTVHPNIDKKMFNAKHILQPKALNKTFPQDVDVGLLKWNIVTQDNNSSLLPLKINCWPSKIPNGCSINIEYELKNMGLQMNDLLISIPLPSGSGAPNMGDYDGEYSLNAAKTYIRWLPGPIDGGKASGTSLNTSGNMEFETKGGKPDDFFPIIVTFSCPQTLTGLKIVRITDADDTEIKHSTESSFYTDDFQIV